MIIYLLLHVFYTSFEILQLLCPNFLTTTKKNTVLPPTRRTCRPAHHILASAMMAPWPAGQSLL